MSLVPASELQKDKEKKKLIKKEIYKNILEIFSKKIKHVAESGTTWVILETPGFVMGCPSFNVIAATTYLERQLRNGGYKTRLVTSSSILVDWSPEPKVKRREGGRATSSTEREVLVDEFSGLINLKKVADKYK